MSKKLNNRNLIVIILFKLITCILTNSDHQSKVTSVTVTASSPNSKNGLLNVYKQMNSDVIYSEPNLDEQKKSKIDLIRKNPQNDLHKRPSQFSDLIENKPLLDKQKAGINLSNSRLNKQKLNENNLKKELNNQFAQSLNYLIKYINKQGQTKLINGTNHTKHVNNILLKHARNLDRENCLLRLICEISSNHEDASDNQLIKEIRIVFSNKHHAPSYPVKKDPSFPFYYAGHVGAITGNAERCLEIFPVCSAKTDELLQIVANANKYSKNQIKLNKKSEKMSINSKLEKELFPTSESRSFSEKMRNKMKKLHKQYIKKIN